MPRCGLYKLNWVAGYNCGSWGYTRGARNGVYHLLHIYVPLSYVTPQAPHLGNNLLGLSFYLQFLSTFIVKKLYQTLQASLQDNIIMDSTLHFTKSTINNVVCRFPFISADLLNDIGFHFIRKCIEAIESRGEQFDDVFPFFI